MRHINDHRPLYASYVYFFCGFAILLYVYQYIQSFFEAMPSSVVNPGVYPNSLMSFLLNLV